MKFFKALSKNSLLTSHENKPV